jgi:hypothetical protein
MNVDASRPRVPFGVLVVAIFEVAMAVLLFLDATGVRPSTSSSIIASFGGQGDAVSWILAGLAVVGGASAIALFRLLPVGLVATTLLAGFGLLNELGSRLGGHADDARLAILVVIVLYLNQPAVREAFGQDDPAARRPTLRGAEGE